MTYHLTTLPNGLRVASEFLPGVESVAVAVSVDVGARYEDAGEGGISHLLEHMAFKGTESRNARAIAEGFDGIGGQFNAYTSLEHTVYYTKVLKEHARLAVEMLADILQNSIFDAEELTREQGVIAQEIAMHFDTPDDLIFDYFDSSAYPDQPMGRSILGTAEGVAATTRENIIAYMKKHYQPERMVISAAGNIRHEDFLSYVTEYFHLPASDGVLAPQPALYRGGDARKNRKLEQLHLIAGLEAVSVRHADYMGFQVFSNILGGGMSSRLFQEVREKRGLAYHISSMLLGYNDTGVLAIYTATGAEHGSGLPLILMDEIKRMGDGVTESELLRAKNQQKAELLMARENPSTVANWIGRHLLVYGEYKRVDDIIRQVMDVSAADIRRYSETLIKSTLTLATLGPVKNVPKYEKVAARLKA